MNRRDFLKFTSSYSVMAPTLLSLQRYSYASTEEHEIEAIGFDGFPIFDPRSILTTVREVLPSKDDEFGKAWFNKIFAYSWLRTSAGQYKNFNDLIGDALDYTSLQFKHNLNTSQRSKLIGAWTQLKLWPDVPAALEKLTKKGIRLAFLSNLTEDMLRLNCRNSNIEEAFEFFLSTDNVEVFKPHPKAYQMGVNAFKLPKNKIAFAAFGGWDAVGASWYGYSTVWVNRFNLPHEILDNDAITSGPGIETLVNFVKA